MGRSHVNARVQKHREVLRKAGLRPVQIWVPDTRQPDFADECRRQCLRVAQADMADQDMDLVMDKVLADVDGWTGCAGRLCDHCRSRRFRKTTTRLGHSGWSLAAKLGIRWAEILPGNPLELSFPRRRESSKTNSPRSE